MNRYWVFASKNKENIKTASERLLWGFWGIWGSLNKSNKKKSKLAKNWRDFLRNYNKISAGDVVFFQLARSGDIHAVGLVKDRFYDDETPVWPEEVNKGKVLFPWRVSFYIIMYSEEPLGTYFTHLEKYVDGYGIGEAPRHEAETVLKRLKEKLKAIGIDIKIA